MPAHYDEKRKRWRWRFRGRICGIRVTITGTPASNTRRAAEQEERLAIERKRKELESPILAREVPTFAEYAQTYRARKAKSWSQETVAAQRGRLENHILPQWGSKRLDEPSKADIQSWIDGLCTVTKPDGRRALSNNTIRAIGDVFKAMLHTAVDDELILRVPTFKLPEAKHRDDYLTEDEIRLLIDVCISTEEQLVVTLGARGGLRAGEMRGLQLTDWHPESRSLRVLRQITMRNEIKAPKAEKTRVVPVHIDLAKALARRAREPHDSPYVLAGARDPYIPASRIDSVIRRLAKRAGLDPKRVHPHLLRHSCASHLAIRGVSLYHIMAILGHSNFATTQRYAKLAPAANVAAIDSIPAA